MTTTLRRLLLAGGLAAALGSSAALAGCGDRPVDHGNMGEPTPSPAATTGAALQPSTDAAAVDAAFVRQMIPHHEMALEMATAVADSVSHQEIEDLADDVIEAQTKEIATLRARAKALGIDTTDAEAKLEADAKTLGLAPDELGMDNHHMMLSEGMSERAFIDGMIPHHEGAIAMANAQLAAGEDAELKQLSKDIVAAQQAEIDQLTAWRDEWYGGEPVDAAPPTTGAHGGEHGAMHE